MSKVLSHSSPFNYRQWSANSQSRKEFATDVAACDAYCLESEFKECDTDGVILGQMPGRSRGFYRGSVSGGWRYEQRLECPEDRRKAFKECKKSC
mgnify:FL=1